MKYYLTLAITILLLTGCGGAQYSTTMYQGEGKDAVALYTLKSNVPATATIKGTITIEQKAVPAEKGLLDTLTDPNVLLPVSIGVAAIL